MSKARTTVSLIDHFSALKDPRQSWRVVYPLREILLLVLCASLCGMEDFVEIRMWGELAEAVGFRTVYFVTKTHTGRPPSASLPKRIAASRARRRVPGRR